MKLFPELPQNIFQLLTKLDKNNDRDWYEQHKSEYIELQEHFKVFGNELLKSLEEFDSFRRMKVYRVYRDLRFSKDKRPYHTYRGISYFRSGKGEYYLHIEPKKSFVLAGYWDISPDELKRLRNEFSWDVSEIQQILTASTFSQHFQGLEPMEVKTAPRGFDKNHPNIEFIRKKSLLVKKHFTDEEVLGSNFFETILGIFKTSQPLLHYIDYVLLTDENGVPIEEQTL